MAFIFSILLLTQTVSAPCMLTKLLHIYLASYYSCSVIPCYSFSWLIISANKPIHFNITSFSIPVHSSIDHILVSYAMMFHIIRIRLSDSWSYQVTPVVTAVVVSPHVSRTSYVYFSFSVLADNRSYLGDCPINSPVI